MSSENNLVLGVLTAVSLLAPAILGFTLGWPLWVVLLAVLVALFGTASLARQLRQRRLHEERIRAFQAKQEVPKEPAPVPEADVEPHRSVLPSMELPSADPDYRFVFTTTVCWWSTRNGVGVPHTNPRAVAEELVVRHAAECVATEAPESVDLAQYRLNVALGTRLTDPSGHVEAAAEDVSLTLSDEDERRLRRLSEVRKDEHVWQRERDFECAQRAYLREDAFQDTASALIWLLAKTARDRGAAAESVHTAVDLLTKLSRITAVVNNPANSNEEYPARTDSADIALPSPAVTPLGENATV